jgi:hypothetical protein
MKAHSPIVKEAVEGGRQNVLACVLLHVIESAWPVDQTMHALPRLEMRRAGVRARRARGI